jgi:hypothetical protein
VFNRSAILPSKFPTKKFNEGCQIFFPYLQCNQTFSLNYPKKRKKGFLIAKWDLIKFIADFTILKQTEGAKLLHMTLLMKSLQSAKK